MSKVVLGEMDTWGSMYWPEGCPRVSLIPRRSLVQMSMAKKPTRLGTFDPKAVVQAMSQFIRNQAAKTSYFIDVHDRSLALAALLACAEASCRVLFANKIAGTVIDYLELTSPQSNIGGIITDRDPVGQSNKSITLEGLGKVYVVEAKSPPSVSGFDLSIVETPNMTPREFFTEKTLVHSLGSLVAYFQIPGNSTITVDTDHFPSYIFLALLGLCAGASISGQNVYGDENPDGKPGVSIHVVDEVLSPPKNLPYIPSPGWTLMVFRPQREYTPRPGFRKGPPHLNCLYLPSVGIPIAGHPLWHNEESIGLPITNFEARVVIPLRGNMYNLCKPGEVGELVMLDTGLNRQTAGRRNLIQVVGSDGLWLVTGVRSTMDNKGAFYLV